MNLNSLGNKHKNVMFCYRLHFCKWDSWLSKVSPWVVSLLACYKHCFTVGEASMHGSCSVLMASCDRGSDFQWGRMRRHSGLQRAHGQSNAANQNNTTWKTKTAWPRLQMLPCFFWNQECQKQHGKINLLLLCTNYLAHLMDHQGEFHTKGSWRLFFA